MTQEAIKNLDVEKLFQKIWALNPLCHWEGFPTDEDSFMRRQMKRLLIKIQSEI